MTSSQAKATAWFLAASVLEDEIKRRLATAHGQEVAVYEHALRVIVQNLRRQAERVVARRGAA